VRVAVVGHVEWIWFVLVPRVPLAGEIADAERGWEEPAGGGAVAAVQLAKLAGACAFYTAVGDDEIGRRSIDGLTALGLEVHAALRDVPTRRGFTFLDTQGERTITVVGEKLRPSAADPLPWGDLEAVDAVYFTGGDPEALRLARRARRLVATSRELATLQAAGVELDALVGSAGDVSERYEPGDLDPPPRAVVRTEGARGGRWSEDGAEGRWEAAPLPGPVADAYGCGDAFAAGLTYGLGAGDGLAAALDLGARCGAACLTGRGPYEAQLRLAG
jgi:ribokinase